MPNETSSSAFRNVVSALEDNLIGVIVGALILGGIGKWTHSMYRTHIDAQVQEARANAGYVMEEGFLNQNTISDKFYRIGEDIAIVELDGKAMVDQVRDYSTASD